MSNHVMPELSSMCLLFESVTHGWFHHTRQPNGEYLHPMARLCWDLFAYTYEKAQKDYINSLPPEIRPAHCEINIGHGRFVICDWCDWELVKGFRWSATCTGTIYAHAWTGGGQKNRKKVLMHRLIMKPSKGKVIDHKNGNGLDNRRCNLRETTRTRNNYNTAPIRGSSNYKGVHLDKQTGKWKASITVGGQRYYLGLHKLEDDAAQAYNTAAEKHFGEFARLNIILTQIEEDVKC